MTPLPSFPTNDQEAPLAETPRSNALGQLEKALPLPEAEPTSEPTSEPKVVKTVLPLRPPARVVANPFEIVPGQ